jgi:hypothetical protein
MENTLHNPMLLPIRVEPKSNILQATPQEVLFITANTIAVPFHEIKTQHIIPVYVKDNETLISHTDFIESAFEAVSAFYPNETILPPVIRVSHPIKGRIPEAKDKPVAQLEEWEKTLYYERMAFVIEIPTIYDDVDGNRLTLTIGGVKAYNLDNLYNRKGTGEYFKLFVGLKNKVCTNLCVWGDGLKKDIRVNSVGMIRGCYENLLEYYNVKYHLHHLNKLTKRHITEAQFAQLIGRCRMYPHLPNNLKKEIPVLQLVDSQINSIVRDYYHDKSFCRDAVGNINLWKLYNLFTEANKSSYIDTFLERSVNSFDFVDQVYDCLEHKHYNWYLS